MSGKKTVNLRGLPADLVNRAKGLAGWNGQSLKEFVTEAIAEKVNRALDRAHAEVDEERKNGKRPLALKKNSGER